LIPVCAFRHKTGTIFIYDGVSGIEDAKWRILDHEMWKALVKHMEKQFLKKFIQWSSENRDILSSTEEKKTEEVRYMSKMICSENKIDKLTTDLRKWFYQTIVEEFRDRN
jgi:hypothetical protein